jgi:hypothetical protein
MCSYCTNTLSALCVVEFGINRFIGNTHFKFCHIFHAMGAARIQPLLCGIFRPMAADDLLIWTM